MKLGEIVATILAKQKALSSRRALLVAISGIDGAGKGFVSARLAAELEERGLNVAVLPVDHWLNLPRRRFGGRDPAAHFYEHAIRFHEMFTQLVEPLTQARALRLETNATEETATEYHKHLYDFREIDVVLLEGIFLFKREHRPRYDLALWIDCSFATALQRAIARGQEGLPPAQTVHAFETIYFPAQRIHLARDQPREANDLIVSNDLPGVPA